MKLLFTLELSISKVLLKGLIESILYLSLKNPKNLKLSPGLNLYFSSQILFVATIDQQLNQ